MFCSVEKFFLYLLVLFVYTHCIYAAPKFKDSLLKKKLEKRQRRNIDGNELPPLPLTGSSNNGGLAVEYRNQGVISRNPQTTTDSGMIEVGSDLQNEFRSLIGDSQTTSPDNTYNTQTGTGSGYRYTSTVYTGPGSQPSYRYRPPYSQLGNTRTGYTTGSGQTQYSPYVGSGVNQNTGNSRVQYVGGGGRFPIYNQNERVYGGSSNYIPNRGVVSNDPSCPTDATPVFINNMGCTQAIDTLGSFICYNYERVSRECCERCLQLKQPRNTGCEYGDWSYQCRNIQPFDCYNARNREICCDTCRVHKERQNEIIPGCEYGDLTPRCQIIREKRHLCYLPENQRLCCVTCPSLSEENTDVCKWGDQNPDLCTPFDQQGQLRINCYMPTVQQICCETCERLKSRVREQISGCEYGDRPVSFSTPRGILDCGNYIRHFGIDVCSNSDVATHCCYTCYRYRAHIQPGKK